MEANRISHESLTAQANYNAHLGRIAERIDRISQLQSLLGEEDKATVVAALRQGGYSVQGDGLEEKSFTEVIAAINALPKGTRTVKGKVRTGEEIARAIPDVEAFLEAMSLRKEGKFFELNGAGQLVMADGCAEAYRLGEDFPTAKIRQTRVYYCGEDGTTQVMEGKDYYKVKEVDGKKYEVKGKVKVLELSEAAKKIEPSIIMKSGLPTLKWDGNRHTEEYASLNTGQFERSKSTWTEDDSLDASRARFAVWPDSVGYVFSFVNFSRNHGEDLGSRGVLRVNLNFES